MNAMRILVSAVLFFCSAFCQVNASPDDRISLRQQVELASLSGLSICESAHLLALRVDQPDIEQNSVSHTIIVIDIRSQQKTHTFEVGSTLNTIGFAENIELIWNSQCTQLYFRALIGGSVQVWTYEISSNRLSQVSFENGDVLQLSLSDDRNGLIAVVDAAWSDIEEEEKKLYESGVLFDNSIYPYQTVYRNLPLRGRWISYRRFDVYSEGHILSHQEKTTKFYDLNSGSWSEIDDPENETLHLSSVPIGSSENHHWADSIIYNDEFVAIGAVATAKRGDGRPVIQELVARRIGSNDTIELCEREDCGYETLAPLEHQPSNSEIYIVAEQLRGAAGIYAIDLRSLHVRTVLETEGMLGALSSGQKYRSQACPALDGQLICTFSDHETPIEVVSIDLADGTTSTLFAPNETLKSQFALRAERLTWKDEFGTSVIGVLVYPLGYEVGNHYPLVISTYNCRGFLDGGFGDGGPEYLLAQEGFVVICIDVNTDFPPSDLTNEVAEAPRRYVSALSQFESAIDILDEMNLIDRGRVGITGVSFSSQAISFAISHADYFQVASLRSLGVWEPENRIHLRPGMPLADAVAESHDAGQDWTNADTVYDNISVTRRAGRVTIPVLVQASDREYLSSLPAFAALKREGRPVEMFVFPEETHLLHQPAHRRANFQRNIDWFKFWLQNVEVSDPTDPDQYVRWRKLRTQACTIEHNAARSYCQLPN